MSAADLQRNYEIGAGLLGNGAQRDEWDALIAKLRGGLIDGSHAGGLDYVPFDGYLAQLHKGERVMTAAENRAYTPTWANYGMGDGVQALVAEVKALRAEISQLKASGDQNAQMLARAAFESNRENAQEVVRGVGQSTVRAAWGRPSKKEQNSDDRCRVPSLAGPGWLAHGAGRSGYRHPGISRPCPTPRCPRTSLPIACICPWWRAALHSTSA